MSFYSFSSFKVVAALETGSYRHTSWAKFRRVWVSNTCPLVDIHEVVHDGKKRFFCTFFVGDFLWFSPFGSWKTACQFDLPF